MIKEQEQKPGYSKFGLPLEVKYCTKCVESNQRMISSAPHADAPVSKKDTIVFSEDGVCSGCRYHEEKKGIDWKDREKQLKDLLDRYRRKDGHYDVLVPGSGGKDSDLTAHILKYKYGMNPLTVTWAPHMYTEIGWKNFQAWIHAGFDNILFTPNGKIHRTLTRLAFKNLLHPFQPFVVGQHALPPKVAIENDIRLIFSGDFLAERGVGRDIKFDGKQVDSRLYSKRTDQSLYLSGVPVAELERYGIRAQDLNPYLPVEDGLLAEHGIVKHHLPYYIDYDPQRSFYYAVEHCGFEVNPDGRSEGTYTKYLSLDDKVDGFHFYTWFIKTGRGRATEDASLDIRNKHITREEGVALVRQFDGEFPKKYFKDFLAYTEMTEEEFRETIDRFRPPHLWEQAGGEWRLKHQVS